jgi:CRP-like cAMP-binding protein
MDTGQILPLHTSRCLVNVRGSNRILQLLPPKDSERILGMMERVTLESRDTVQETGKPIEHAYFPLTCAMSLVIAMRDGDTVEAATTGNEGMVGVSLLMGATDSTVDAFAQVPGEALRMSRRALEAELRAGGVFPDLMRRYGEAYLTQVAQSAACNRLHPVEQRLCRWILMTHDRVGLDRLPLTQEYIATMLGVRRASVSITASVLQKAGLIHYVRGKIDVLDRAGLEHGSCECYDVVRKELERMLCDDAVAVATHTASDGNFPSPKVSNKHPGSDGEVRVLHALNTGTQPHLAMNWTTTRPKAPGYYWIREPGESDTAHIVEIGTAGVVYVGIDEMAPAGITQGMEYWPAPLEAPF